MRTDPLSEYINLRRELAEERGRVQARLRQINEALGDLPPPSLSAVSGAGGLGGGSTGNVPIPVRRGRRPAGDGFSLRDLVIDVLRSGPKTKEEVLAAVKARGYRFKTNNPMNSLGVVLYGTNPKLRREGERFALPAGFAVPPPSGMPPASNASTQSRTRSESPARKLARRIRKATRVPHT